MARELRDRLEFRYIKVDEIDVSEANVRKSHLEEGIEDLANSIREIGVRQPVTVFKKGGRYELIIGQRRYLACKKAGETEIPALIVKLQDTTDAFIKSLSENIHRRELDYRDKMAAALELKKRLGSISTVAKHLGVSHQTVRNYLGYAAVPDEIKAMVAGKKFSASVAMRIVQGIPDEKLALEVARKIKDVPRSEQKNLLVDVAIQNPREKRIAVLEKTAQSMSQMKKITIYVTQTVYDAICNAAKEYQGDSQMIVKDAIEEWLTQRNFLK